MAHILRNEQIEDLENNPLGGRAKHQPLGKPQGVFAPPQQAVGRLRTAFDDLGNIARRGIVQKGLKGQTFEMSASAVKVEMSVSEMKVETAAMLPPPARVLRQSPQKAPVKRETKIVRQEQDSNVTLETNASFATARTNATQSERISATVSEVTTSFSRQRLEAVFDIDADDGDFTDVCVTDFAEDIMHYLRSMEVFYTVPADYMTKSRNINTRMRSVLLDWLVEVHGQYSYNAETLQYTQKYLDLFLALTPNVDKKELQLVGITCLFIAAKMEEVFTPGVKDFVVLCDHAYDRHQVIAMEQRILETLKFNVTPPLPCVFLRRFSKAAKSDIKLHSASKFLMELAVLDYRFVSLPPSALAAASIGLALMLFRKKSLHQLWTPTLQHYTNYSLEDIRPVVLEIARCLESSMAETKLLAVRKKYEKSKSLVRVARCLEFCPEMWTLRVYGELDPEYITNKLPNQV